MNDERMKVLELLEKGAISAEEATQLLDAIDTQESRKENMMQQREENARLQGKKLRVQVNGDAKDIKNMNINVSIPLVLARHVDNIIANTVPKAANDELKEHGVDLGAINLSAIVDTLEDLDEDIVQADIDSDETKLQVRVYVE